MEMEIVEKDGKFDFLRDGELVKSSVPRAMLQCSLCIRN